MNKYLLLRDNKQTGPYSQEELIAKGFKAYDLVWLEGRSAAWRYPSEFPDLKAHAPAVEEQPYDRFYKKSSEQTSNTEFLEARSAKKEVAEKPAAVTGTATAPVVEFIEQEPVAKPVSIGASKKIYVTMPASNGHVATTTNGKAAANTVKKEEYTAQDSYLTTLPVRKSGGKALVRTMIAACLILGGVVIGLAISYYYQQGNKKDLEKLVNRIREREKANQAANKPVEPPPAIPAATPAVIPDSIPLENTVPPDQQVTDIADNTTSKPANTGKKDSKMTMVDRNLPVSNQLETVKISPAVMDSKEKVTYEAALETARKNIYSLVNVAPNKYKIGVLGGISDLYITLSNNSLYPLDQVSVEVKYFGPEKRLVKTQTLLFNDIAAGEQKTLEVPKTSRGVSIDYSITQINSRVLGLAKARF